jgi:hypothetical protein
MRNVNSIFLKFVFFLFLVLHKNDVDAKKTKLTWVNGIAYGLHHMEVEKHGISKYFGGKEVDYCHNPTSMSNDEDILGYYTDLTQAGTQKLGRMTSEVNKLVEHLRASIAEVGRDGRVIHIAHSQGALVTALASKLLTPLEMSQMEVIAFGGAAAIRRTPQTPFHRVMNYYSVNDPLLLVVPSAAQALRSGIVGSQEEFCFLAPRIGDPVQDHALLAPTYAQALAWEGQRYQQEYFSLAYRMSQSMHVLLWTLWQQLFVVIQTWIRRFVQSIFLPMYFTLRNIWNDSGLNERLIQPFVTCLAYLYLLLQRFFVVKDRFSVKNMSSGDIATATSMQPQ